MKISKQRKEFRVSNKEHLASLRSAQYFKDKEKNTIKRQESYSKNRARILSKVKTYRENNKDKVAAYRKKNQPYSFMRKSIGRILKNWKGGRSKAEMLNGYSEQELKSHLESLFAKGMSWDNYGFYGWHIDHIKPIKAFAEGGVTDPKVINALSNLQPLWAIDNLRKSAKYDD